MTRTLALTETHIPAYPLSAEKIAPSTNENAVINAADSLPKIDILSGYYYTFSALKLKRYITNRIIEKTNANLNIVPY